MEIREKGRPHFDGTAPHGVAEERQLGGGLLSHFLSTNRAHAISNYAVPTPPMMPPICDVGLARIRTHDPG